LKNNEKCKQGLISLKLPSDGIFLNIDSTFSKIIFLSFQNSPIVKKINPKLVPKIFEMEFLKPVICKMFKSSQFSFLQLKLRIDRLGYNGWASLLLSLKT